MHAFAPAVLDEVKWGRSNTCLQIIHQFSKQALVICENLCNGYITNLCNGYITNLCNGYITKLCNGCITKLV